MVNDELFQLYDSDLVLRLRNEKNLSDTRKILIKFKQYLNVYPPSPELAKDFLAQSEVWTPLLGQNRVHVKVGSRCHAPTKVTTL